MAKTPTQLIDELIKREGGYVNDPKDSGGETKYGITVKRAREALYSGPMVDLPYELAFNIYKHDYWVMSGAEMVYAQSADLAVSLFDFGVHSGTKMAANLLQKLLNALNDEEKLYPDLKVDGLLGAKTNECLSKYIKARGVKGLQVLQVAVDSLRIAFMVDTMTHRSKDEKYGYGWLLRVVDLHE